MNSLNTLARTVFHIPGFGRPFYALASARGLVAMALPNADIPPGDDPRPCCCAGAQKHLDAAKNFLRAYFGREPSPQTVIVDKTGWTPFQTDIYETLIRVPFGEVVTYGQLALLAGHPNKARAVGAAMKNNRCPIVIPCHRVVAAGQKLGGWSGPAGFKEKLLHHEGSAPLLLESVS